jgi:hypothetical protein
MDLRERAAADYFNAVPWKRHASAVKRAGELGSRYNDPWPEKFPKLVLHFVKAVPRLK